ncbi:hypothetical protein LX32DRAFT_556729, partial [Colletotrichum zoysiae]
MYDKGPRVSFDAHLQGLCAPGRKKEQEDGQVGQHAAEPRHQGRVRPCQMPGAPQNHGRQGDSRLDPPVHQIVSFRPQNQPTPSRLRFRRLLGQRRHPSRKPLVPHPLCLLHCPHARNVQQAEPRRRDGHRHVLCRRHVHTRHLVELREQLRHVDSVASTSYGLGHPERHSLRPVQVQGDAL